VTILRFARADASQNEDMKVTLSPEIVERGIEIAAVPWHSCLICGTTGEELYAGMTDWLFGAPGTWGIRTCRCGIVWLDPQPTVADIPKLYSRYYTHGDAAEPTRFELIRRETLKCILARLGYPVERSQQLLPKLLSCVRSVARAKELEVLALRATEVGTLLDVGCGNGDFLKQMRSLGWSVTGVDPDPSAVSYGVSQGLQVFNGTIADVPLDARYDVITLSHVLEHVADPVDLLRKCKQRLRPDTGRIVITTPNTISLGHRWFGRHWRGLEVPRHLIMLSPAALSHCVSQAGLRLRSLSTETRMARFIYMASACARKGEQKVGERRSFDRITQIGSYFFAALENILISLKEDWGEELFCVCTARAN